jgi:hypothetical protein
MSIRYAKAGEWAELRFMTYSPRDLDFIAALVIPTPGTSSPSAPRMASPIFSSSRKAPAPNTKSTRKPGTS